MLKDFEVISYSYKNEITIVPLADLHLGASNCNINEIKKVIKNIAEKDNCYTVLAGDIIDNAIITGKVASAVYENNKSPMQQIQEAVEILRPIKDKILAVVSGNHEDRSTKCCDINPLYLICCELGIQNRYRSSMAIVKIRLGARLNNEGLGRRQSYTILLHHGKGSSETALKKDHDFINQFEDCDCIITGHTHNGRVAKWKKYGVSQNDTVYVKDITAIVCNSFLEEADYALKSMLVGASNDIISFDLKLGEKKILVHY